MRTSYRMCKVCGDLHEVGNWPDNHREWMPDNRSDLAAPMLIRDSMDAVKSMLDGKMYDSKRGLRRTYREAGVIEVGDDKSYTDPEYMRRQAPAEVKRQKQKSRKKVEAAVGKALSQAGFGA
jgi:hypothetical protein